MAKLIHLSIYIKHLSHNKANHTGPKYASQFWPMLAALTFKMIKSIFILALLLPYLAMAEGSKSKMTPLDTALLAAQKNEEHQSAFYNAFLNSELFIPTHTMTENDQRRRASENETISPIFVESEGVQYLMLFDSKERLSSWAQREMGFVALPGHAIVEMMSPEFHWALNVGTDYVKTFVPEEIQWLKSSLDQSKGQETTMTAGTNVLIGAPVKIPNGLIDSLTNSIKRNPEIKRAYLGQVYYEKEGEIPHLTLVLEIPNLPKSTLEAIRTDLSTASKGFLSESEHIDIMVNDGFGVAHEITKAVKPFYKAKK